MSWVDTYVSYCFFIGMAAPVVFVIVYSTMPWSKTWEGRVLMFKQALWVGFLLNGVLYFAFGEDHFGRDALRILLFTALPLSLWSLTILLIARKWEARSLRSGPPEMRPAEQETSPSG